MSAVVTNIISLQFFLVGHPKNESWPRFQSNLTRPTITGFFIGFLGSPFETNQQKTSDKENWLTKTTVDDRTEGKIFDRTDRTCSKHEAAYPQKRFQTQ